MSSSKRLLLLLALPLALSQASRTAHAQAPGKSGAISCPASLSVTESATAPAGWLAEPAKTDHLLQRISVFQKSPAEEVFDLAPDRTSRQASIVQQQWTIARDPELKTYLRCRYRGTEATLIQALGPEIKLCTFKFKADAHGMVTNVLDIHCK
jgi:hypothetical protein